MATGKLAASPGPPAYLAQHWLLRRPCVLKLIRPEQAGSQEMLARFEREVQVMFQLTHPNTVEIYDFGRTDDGAFFYANAGSELMESFQRLWFRAALLALGIGGTLGMVPLAGLTAHAAGGEAGCSVEHDKPAAPLQPVPPLSAKVTDRMR